MQIHYTNLFVAFSILAYPGLLDSADRLPTIQIPAKEPYLKQGMDDSFKIVRPTVFLYLRNSEIDRADDFVAEIESIIKAVNEYRSKEFNYDSKFLDPWTENIGVIEEAHHWVVVFHLRGNGNVIREECGIYTNPAFFRAERIYYVAKDDHKIAIDPPLGSIVEAPDYLAHITFRIPLAYPDDNTGSFMNHTEAWRRTVETLAEEEIE